MRIEVNAATANFLRISVLRWADLLATYSIYLAVNYLTDVWNLSIIHAAGIVNISNGITPVLAIVFAFFVDAFMGDFFMLAVSSIAYCIGLGLLSMSTPPVFGSCKDYKHECIGHTQKILFFIALSLIAVGRAGYMVSSESFLDLQTESENENEKGTKKKRKNGRRNKKIKGNVKRNKKKMGNAKRNKNKNNNQSGNDERNKKFRQRLNIIMVISVVLAGGFGLSQIKSWSLLFGIPAICSVVATLLFFSGSLEYKHNDPQGSPLTSTVRVFVATARNFSQPIPDPKDLYNDEDTPSTRSLRCFDKAAIKLPEEQQWNRWKVCKVYEVEDTKIGIRMIPMWLTFIVIGIVLSVGNTYYVEQANNLDQKLGKIKVPIQVILAFSVTSSVIFAILYSFLSRLTKKYAPPIGIATGMILSILCCITAAKVETRRLHRIRDHDLLDKPEEEIPMSIFALFPQFLLLAAVDGISRASILDFFSNQTPASLHEYLIYFTQGVLGLGTMASVLSVYVVGKVSQRNGKPNWFQDALNKSRFDRYYWVLAVLSAVNLSIYVIIAYFYKYKEPPNDEDDELEVGEI